MRRDEKLPTKTAYFSDDDARFAIVDGEPLPVIFTDKVDDQKYRERLKDFDGRREEFVNLADRSKLAVMVRELGEEWHMIGVYEISGVQTYDDPFECIIGKRIARLEEVEAPEPAKK